jgi:hypothetical protein
MMGVNVASGSEVFHSKSPTALWQDGAVGENFEKNYKDQFVIDASSPMLPGR